MALAPTAFLLRCGPPFELSAATDAAFSNTARTEERFLRNRDGRAFWWVHVKREGEPKPWEDGAVSKEKVSLTGRDSRGTALRTPLERPYHPAVDSFMVASMHVRKAKQFTGLTDAGGAVETTEVFEQPYCRALVLL
ncbi:hypothetical protein BKA65DRAFT_473807 [Rhexocercosporidium sp. MPI-PUGE-AT-0058]|nr:hypothetical protein BKA65DRAFT_473807 [Rhexocercosporidium sp. MPI-PUGE-AT-0058]